MGVTVAVSISSGNIPVFKGKLKIYATELIIVFPAAFRKIVIFIPSYCISVHFYLFDYRTFGLLVGNFVYSFPAFLAVFTIF
jgi:hypothetical protein